LRVRGLAGTRRPGWLLASSSVESSSVNGTKRSWPRPASASSSLVRPAGRRNCCGPPRWHPMTPKPRPCSPRPRNWRPRTRPATGGGHQHRGLVPGVLPGQPARPVTVPGRAPPRRAAGRAPGPGCSAGVRARGAARRSAGVPPRLVPGPRHPGAHRDRGRGARRADRPRPGRSWPAGDQCPAGQPSRFLFPAAMLIP
jgi:hypothetical protein